MLYLVGALTLFHILILLKVIPYDITWGGRLNNDSEMYAFESASLLINLLLGLVLLIKGKLIKPIFSIRIANVILWLFFILFGLNTVGNLLAKTNFEKFFTIPTLLAGVLIWVILRSKK